MSGRKVLHIAFVSGLLLAAGAPAAQAQQQPTTGGMEAIGAPGGAAFAPPRVSIRPVVREFAITPGALAPGAPATVTLRIDGPTQRARVRVDVVRPGTQRVAARIDVGLEPTGRRVTHAWVPRGKPLTAGAYVARLHAVDDAGRRLRRSARAPGRVALRVVAPPAPAPSAPRSTPPGATTRPGGLFPVQGAYSFGGPDARFGAGRAGHVHQGQDVMAAEGTPLVSPRAGVVYWRAYQAAGAGNYLVIRADDGRDLVFMHLRDGSLTVDKGAAVAAGQRIGEVGNTGRSFGAHLHFEIWPGGWYAKGSSPVDPLPQLQAWAAGR